MKLPNPKFVGTMSVEECMSKRRSTRSFSKRKLNWDEIGQLLWAGQGITLKFDHGPHTLRTSPSAGATFPMELYIVMNKGLFHYIPQDHAVDLITDQDLTNGLNEACYQQECVSTASVNFIICAIEERIFPRYGERGLRYIDMEAGHIAQNIHLQAVALNLGSVPVGAFDESVAKIALSSFFPQNTNPVYILSVGEIK